MPPRDEYLPVIDAGGEPRKLGCLPTPPILKGSFPLFGDRVKVIPRDKWEACDRRHLVRRVFDQDGIGSCASESTTQTLEIARSIAGNDDVKLSPANLYGRVNGGRDAGSTLGENLREIQNRGVCTEDLVGHLDWRQWNTSGWEKEGKRYRVTEIYLCNSFDAIISAVLLGFPVVYGVMVGNNFNPDSDGWLPDYTGGSGGHAMTGIDVGKRGGKWGLGTVNSWSTGWGDAGYCYLPESYFRTYWEDAFAVRVTIDPTNDGDLA
jgi:hypothetical protein